MEYEPKIGDVVKIYHILGDWRKRFDGAMGVIKKIDSKDSLYGTWGNITINPYIDDFEVIEYG
jgi:hypothetical protein